MDTGWGLFCFVKGTPLVAQARLEFIKSCLILLRAGVSGIPHRVQLCGHFFSLFFSISRNYKHPALGEAQCLQLGTRK